MWFSVSNLPAVHLFLDCVQKYRQQRNVQRRLESEPEALERGGRYVLREGASIEQRFQLRSRAPASNRVVGLTRQRAPCEVLGIPVGV